MTTEESSYIYDTTWIERLRTGDPTLFEDLYQRFGKELLAFLAARCPSGSSPEDLCQSIWLKIWNNRENFSHGDFRPWMYRIAKNFLIDQYRKKSPISLAEEIDLAAPEHDPADDRMDALKDCLEQVEGTFVEIIRGKTQGLSTDQLASMYQINSKTVATRIHRGKQLLRECVERKSS